MIACHERATRRRAYGAAGVRLRETNAFRSNTVNIRGRDLSLPVASQVAVPQIVGQYENHVGLALDLRV